MNSNLSKFKLAHPFEKRQQESKRILDKYPDRLPVICEVSSQNKEFELDKKKYLLPNDLSLGQFNYVIRKRIKISAQQALFLFVDNILPPTNEMMINLYNNYKDDDGFLYVTISSENTFGK